MQSSQEPRFAKKSDYFIKWIKKAPILPTGAFPFNLDIIQNSISILSSIPNCEKHDSHDFHGSYDLRGSHANYRCR